MIPALITPENLTKDLLKLILDSAMIDNTFNSNGWLVANETIKVLVSPEGEKKDRIHLCSLFTLKDGLDELVLLRAVNKINEELTIVRAYIDNDKDNLFFDWSIPVMGGTTPKNFVLALKRFSTIPHIALEKCGQEICK